MDTQTLLRQAEFEQERMRCTTQDLNELSALFEAMTDAMKAPDFVPLPAYTVEPWKEFDREISS